jgi:uracil-DNA glycosylase family 4
MRDHLFHPATGCAKCPVLAAQRQHVVWGKGPDQAAIMMIGEAPGFYEDREGIPWVGRAGREKDKLLTQAGIDPATVHDANRIMCHPPGNRDPEPEEMANCEPWLVEHIRMVNPLGVVLFGRSAISWRFDKPTVQETLGLMYRMDCDACGGTAGHHLHRLAADGHWTENWTCEEQSPELVRKRVYASVYHPAATLGGRDQGYVPLIVRELRRLAAEVELLRGPSNP